MNNIKILQKLAALKAELIRRNHFTLARYNTGKIVHKKQLQFHKCDKRNRWVFGGNRTGKTECGAVESIWLARGNHPYRKNKKDVTGWVVSLSTKVQKEVSQEKILKYLNKSWIYDIVMKSGSKGSAGYGIIDTIILKNVFGGLSRISFKSCEEGREKFQGTSLDFVWFDEEPPKDIYEECVMRVIDKRGDVFGTMTPLKGMTFVYDQIYLNPTNDPEIFCMFMEWQDNPFLPKEEIDRLTASLSPEELENRRYGRFVNLSNSLVYKEFDEQVNVIEPFPVPPEWQCNISIDPGLSNPLSAHWYAVDFDDNVYVIAEHFESNKTIEYHSTKIKEISDSLNWRRGRNGMIEALIDSAANQKTLASTKSVTELFYDNGILANPNVNKDLFSGISRVKSYLKNEQGKSKLFIFSCCTNLIRELKSYYWSEGDRPRKFDDHALDELRYFIMSRPENKPPLPVKSEITKDKERLYKKLQNARKNYGKYY